MISPEQAGVNVLQSYFNDTPVAAAFGGTMRADPMNFMQIYYPDVQYAESHPEGGTIVDQSGGIVPGITAQSLLDLASQKLLEIAEPAAPVSPGPVPMLIRVP